MSQRRCLVEEADRGKTRGDTLFFLRLKRVTSDEPAGFFELHEETQPGLDRGVDFIEVVAIERITLLKTQGITRAEPARNGSCRDKPIPPAADLLEGSEEFETLLAGVAGAAEDHLTEFADAIVCRHPAGSGLDLVPEGDGFRPLDRESPEFGAAVVKGHAFAGMGEHPFTILVNASGVDDEEKALLAGPVGNEVVDDATVFIQEQGVLPLADGERGEVVGEESIEPVQSPGSLDLELAHVGNVEDPHRVSHGLMLGDDALVLDRHFPAGERHDAGAEGEMAVVEGGTIHDGSVATPTMMSTEPSVIRSKEHRSSPIAFEIAANPRTFPTMIYEKGNRLLDQLERRLGRLTLPHILRWIAGFQVLTWALSLISPDFLGWLGYDREAILDGQVWRLLTWAVYPASDFVLIVVFAALFMFFINDSLEAEWDSFRLNLYVLASILILSAIGFIPFATLPGYLLNTIFYSSVFLAFTSLFPHQVIHLFGIIPIKAKWLGWANVAYLAAMVLTAPLPLLLGALVLIGLLPFLITFGPRFLESVRSESKAKVRRHQFESEIATGDSFHECTTCKATEKTHPERAFRVAADGNEFCDSCRKPI